MLVVSRNLVMLTAAWMLTSYGLHHLLQHYPDRPWAVWAARKKFLISRLGDAFLIAAVGLTIWCLGSSEYATIFARADELRRSGGPVDPRLTAAGILFVLGAMTKSAQFPFHSWLPDTMEAPTPVSALMHAGIINAGGFLAVQQYTSHMTGIVWEVVYTPDVSQLLHLADVVRVRLTPALDVANEVIVLPDPLVQPDRSTVRGTDIPIGVHRIA
jgi:NADH:ubiquinone oxidoreductase subunit 5 (subunit L)/multisubunit Na+/H+ antiporter MnhA subunit